ncbi:hypothetical protein EYF80_004444 [Liparis tanakae]|uniref:Uncharacterized protein n=1 Tax=Liparis tanakae TaxID=230148 RepID=A0A4Z2J7K5_9TELE|nr:hypothetical protein EYF80_004444 [Liparis tanakae]
MPNDHTSDLMVNFPYSAASGAVHLMGNFAPAGEQRGKKCRKDSGDMVPGFRVFTATLVVPFHVPVYTRTEAGVIKGQHRFIFTSRQSQIICLVFWSGVSADSAPSMRPSSSGGDWLRTHPDLPKLPVSEPLDELQRLPRDLPHVFGFNGQVGEARHPFMAGNHQATAEPGGSVCTRQPSKAMHR